MKCANNYFSLHTADHFVERNATKWKPYKLSSFWPEIVQPLFQALQIFKIHKAWIKWELAGESLHESFLNSHCLVKRAVRVAWELMKPLAVYNSHWLSCNSHDQSNKPNHSLTLIKVLTSSTLMRVHESCWELVIKRESESCDSHEIVSFRQATSLGLWYSASKEKKLSRLFI